MAPVVTVEDLLTSDATPAQSGSTDDATANVRVTLGTETYEAINYGDGTWALLDNTISDGLVGGSPYIDLTNALAMGDLIPARVSQRGSISTIP